MKRKYLTLLVAIVAMLPTILLAQCPPTAHAFLDANQSRAAIGNGGEPFYVDGVNIGYAVPANTNNSPIFSSSLWVGGVDSTGALHVSASNYRQSGHEFYAGPVRTNQNYNCSTGFDQQWQKVWRVTKSEVNQFRLDQNSGSVNFSNYPDIETWPGNGNVSQTEDARLAPFVDVNQDGLYRPAQDGDYPCFPGDMGLWWVYNADGPHDETGSTPFPLQIENLAYAYNCQSGGCDTTLDYVTFFHREITNRSAIDLYDVYLTIYMDIDLGSGQDDYIGSDSVRGLAFGFNGDASDVVYGLNPPAFGSLHLPNADITEMDGAMFFNNDFSPTGNPEIALNFYGYMQCIWKDGSHLVDNGSNGYGTGATATFAFPGDPGFCGGSGSGWSESSAGNPPSDRRILQNFGPFNLPAGGSITLDNAFIYARGYFNDELGSVCALKQAADVVAAFWADSIPFSCNVTPLAIQPAAPVAGITVSPNPSTGQLKVYLPNEAGELQHITCFDLQGKQVMQQSGEGREANIELDLKDLPNGVYVLQVQTSLGLINKKIVLSR